MFLCPNGAKIPNTRESGGVHNFAIVQSYQTCMKMGFSKSLPATFFVKNQIPCSFPVSQIKITYKKQLQELSTSKIVNCKYNIKSQFRFRNSYFPEENMRA